MVNWFICPLILSFSLKEKGLSFGIISGISLSLRERARERG
jgi:hypothetical protein